MKYLFIILLAFLPCLSFGQWCADCCDAEPIEPQELTLTRSTEKVICYEARGYGNVVEYQHNVTVTNNSNGFYTVRFNVAHPQGTDYTVVWGGEEDANRDVPKHHIVRFTRGATAFQFYVTVDDNGGAADIPDDSGWHFMISCDKEFVTDVQISN